MAHLQRGHFHYIQGNRDQVQTEAWTAPASGIRRGAFLRAFCAIQPFHPANGIHQTSLNVVLTTGLQWLII